MTLTDAHFEQIRQLVEEYSAIVLADNKRYLVEARIRTMLRDASIASFDELCTRLRRPGAEELRQEVVEALTTNETSFFRDPDAFRCLKQDVFPTLLATEDRRRPLRIWSAACSSGQELYSVLMLLHEHFPEHADRPVEFIATDIDRKMLRRAELACYNELESTRGLSPNLRAKYFRQDGKNWCVNETLRGQVRFRQLNLAEPWIGLPRFDLVLMRYVLIYFDQRTRDDILTRVRQKLTPEGFVLLGASETSPSPTTGLVGQRSGRSTVFRHAHAVNASAA